ncbi:DNA repair protein [Aspergillus sclerotialis]|uniref:DNA repair protein n=1 Tax=Aspergillus sclerotialis TaxID=2070753 RepID=A0A3A2Z5L0_9EURO|nr:DNA repair protein [Aspergillus sclerotialis]
MRRGATRPARGRNRQTRRTGAQDDGHENEIPGVYREMLAEAEARSVPSIESERSTKRRRVGERSAYIRETESPEIQVVEDKNEGGHLQTVYDYDAPSDDDSDIEWEDIDLQQVPSDTTQTPVSNPSEESLQITFGPGTKETKKVVRRHKPLSAAEKKLRLDIHKAHVLCLLRHVDLRNRWCNDSELQDLLMPMLSRRTIALLNPRENQEKFTRSTEFMNGLNEAADIFGRRFRITSPGMRRAYWTPDPESLKQKMKSMMSNAEVFLSKEDFIKQAKTLSGSRDFGAQLFCALLRSVAVEARIVCSLQPLPFSGTVKDMNPKSFHGAIPTDGHGTSANELSTAASGSNTSRPGIRRINQPQFSRSHPARNSTRDPPAILRESPYPVFWVEAFNEAVQKWIVADVMVTKTLAKPHRLEPPSGDSLNSMSYVVAFEEDVSAKDVTRRYTNAFNTKVHKLRVESTKGGEEWWKKTMRFYEKPFADDRDINETAEMTSKTAGEPMPRSIQDFKTHPFYALERHLRRNEVIFPKRQTGTVAVGRSGSENQTQEPVYRRSDVHLVRSATGWYRLGRDIKMGEQPLKRVSAHPNKNAVIDVDEDDMETAETALYAEFQTEPYKPPPVVGGKVPKNAYGNLDVYMPSMIPPGGIHIRHPDATQAAKILGIDYSPAVTGFDFKGRHGTAGAELEAKTTQALRLWKGFLVRLRIAERVKGYAVEGDNGPSSEMSDVEYEESEDTAGGFLPESDQGSAPPVDNSCKHEQDETLGGGFIPDEGEINIEQSASTHFEPNHTQRRQHTERSSRYSLVVVPKDQFAENVSRIPKNLDSTESQTTIAPSSEAKAAVSGGHQHGLDAKSRTISVEEKSTADNMGSFDPKEPSPQAGSQADAHGYPDNGSDSDYQGSMLSEDPEDADSFPEWLL